MVRKNRRRHSRGEISPFGFMKPAQTKVAFPPSPVRSMACHTSTFCPRMRQVCCLVKPSTECSPGSPANCQHRAVQRLGTRFVDIQPQNQFRERSIALAQNLSINGNAKTGRTDEQIALYDFFARVQWNG